MIIEEMSQDLGSNEDRVRYINVTKIYICILSSYLILGHLKEIGEVTDQWKQSTTTDFDVSACSRILDALADVELTEIAHNFHMLLVQKNSDPTIGS